MKLICPSVRCRSENDPLAESCPRCGTPLGFYSRLFFYPAYLFNLGLAAARQNDLSRARDLFAAVVYWSPLDQEARNALALACYIQGDHAAASGHWEMVLSRSSKDPLAVRGIAALLSTQPKPKPRRSSKTPPKKGKKGRNK